MTLAELAQKAGYAAFQPYQIEAFEAAAAQQEPRRRLLYYKTGAGKTVTSLVDMSIWNVTEVLVITPPATFNQWIVLGRKLGIEVECISHAKFRMPDYKVSKHKAVIVDEFHMLGGHTGKGWKKMDLLARHLTKPLIICSATPNYNDAERVYCIQHVLDPLSCRGGYIEFLYANCETEANRFSMTPNVVRFRNHRDAAHYLSELPNVDYLEDDLVYTIDDLPVSYKTLREFYVYGYDHREHRIMASRIETDHKLIQHSLIKESGVLEDDAWNIMMDIIMVQPGPVMVFATHSTVAASFNQRLLDSGYRGTFNIVTGKTSTKRKQELIEDFNAKRIDILIGTASLATGTDGMDKVCDTMIILDDTNDAAQRRQLIGRIMPRGLDTDVSKKRVYRLVLQ